ncbi:cytochrome P450 [Rhodocollybia butyracea]|uniref:Cytochrome P450 n=1 Tax=Rhodocollybia butyracea TaxID=206335 RepID=A0A9P5U993_9AGAR|nr:cytochrome P450 [Rhodocollybia butyracea]
MTLSLSAPSSSSLLVASGDLVYIREKNTLILNNSQVAIDLLEKRARIYSDRETSLAVKLLSQSLMYAALYGLEIGYEDPLAQNTILLPGFPALERFPWLRFMPSSFPGCEFKRAVNECAQGLDDIETIPFDKAVNNLKTGAGTSLVAELALENKGRPELIELIKTMGTNGFIAAADTTMSSIGSFRLTTFEDRQSLPYVEAIYREIMRLHPPLPLGINHVLTEDDFYMGYHIPKGCIVVPNIWAMNRDPNVYSEPDKFIPEPFLDSPDGPFTSINNIYTFGFGRRVCVGRYMGDNTVWLAIASVLATLDLRKAKDNEGNEVDIPGEYTQTFFRHPKPYRCCIRPRDARASELILAAAGGV